MEGKKMSEKSKIMLGDLTHTGADLNADHFPLGIGLLASYTLKKLEDQVEVSLHKLPEELLEEFEKKNPDFLCLSSYNWNERLSYAIAEYAKKINPKIITIFGGPNFPISKTSRKKFLKERPAIDFYIKSDGEYAFVRLIKQLIAFRSDVESFKLSEISLDNLCYVTGDQYVEGGDERIADLLTIPSPYVMGLMDKFFELKLIPSIQTNRGCPYQCTYCTDGSPLAKKVYMKNEEYMREELEYIASHVKLSPTLAFCDLNFGSFKEDLKTAKIIRDIRKKYNWPAQMYGSTGKAQPVRMKEVGGIINEGDVDVIKMGSSLQTVSNEVLKAIKRKNLKAPELKELHHSNNYGQDFTELIIPLPRETKESFINGLGEIIDDIKFNNIAIHHLSMLKGSEMETEEERNEHSLETKFRAFAGCLGNYMIGEKNTPIAEIEETVIQTNTMLSIDYFYLRITALLVKIFIDGDTYKSIIQILRRLDIKSIDVLLEIQDNAINKSPRLKSYMRDYIEAAKAKLFDTEDELEKTLSSPEATEEFLDSELGQNELLNFRARAVLDYADECDMVLKLAVTTILKKKGIWSDELSEYFNEAFRFCNYRRFNSAQMGEVEADFSFDFIKGDSVGFEIDPEEIRRDVKIRFYYGEEKNTFQKHLEWHGDSTYAQWGKFIQKMNWIRMRKRIGYVGARN
tara:strand:+ start:275 stop:2329 length:2055 start_codon:yes stop_codon:yes gene_type:complete